MCSHWWHTLTHLCGSVEIKIASGKRAYVSPSLRAQVEITVAKDDVFVATMAADRTNPAVVSCKMRSHFWCIHTSRFDDLVEAELVS